MGSSSHPFPDHGAPQRRIVTGFPVFRVATAMKDMIYLQKKKQVKSKKSFVQKPPPAPTEQ